MKHDPILNKRTEKGLIDLVQVTVAVLNDVMDLEVRGGGGRWEGVASTLVGDSAFDRMSPVKIRNSFSTHSLTSFVRVRVF